MSVYDDLWHDRVAPNARSRLLMTHLMYMADNTRYDRFMQDMRRLGKETLAKANAGKKRAMLKLLHLDDLPTLAKLARRGIGG
jgi:digeranylgeranylglycerophospholipid reductase